MDLARTRIIAASDVSHRGLRDLHIGVRLPGTAAQLTMGALTDIQSRHDSRGVPIEEVGIRRLSYPVIFDDGTINQSTTA